MSALQDSELYIMWRESLRAADTKAHYINHLTLFCRFHSTTPEALAKEPLEVSKQKILKYLFHLKAVARPTGGKGPRGSISVNSIPTYLNGVQSFYTFLEKDIPWKAYRRMLPERATSDLRSYLREEIKALLQHADLRDRVIILLMVAAGPRVGALPELKIKHVSTIANNIGMLKIYPDSARSHYVSLLTPEAMNAIEAYKLWRKQHGEKITPESWLLREKFSEFGDKRNGPRQMTRQGIYVTIVRLMKKAKIEDRRLQPDHSFRYFFDTTVMNADVKHEFKELFMGHSVGLDDYYYDAETKESQTKILFEYSKAVDHLTINEEYRLSKQVVILKKELEGAAPKDMVADLLLQNRSLTDGMAEMKEQIEFLKKWRRGDIQPG